jgi:histidine triad (HIT) family protein
MNCLFCSIVAGVIPADKVFESKNVVAFNDINPQAPVHILIIPKSHHTNVAELAEAESETLTEMFNVANELASQKELNGYRTVFNTGEDGGQTVFHAHLHLIGGRAMHWPPG